MFLCRVPAYADLPPIVGAPLVKSSPATALLQTPKGGPPEPVLFNSVVPEDMARSLSRCVPRKRSPMLRHCAPSVGYKP